MSPSPETRMQDTEKPIVDRPCPKCGGKQAYGPEFRRGVGSDEGLGEHLRYYCCTCRYMSSEPTADQDTPERRRELAAAFERHRVRKAAEQGQPHDRHETNGNAIESVRRQATSRRSYGWK